MNRMKGLLFGAAITLGEIAACNYTVGECYYLGEGGGSGSEAVTAGGGVIIPTGPSGAGGFGDAPPKQPQDATNPPPPDCNIVEDTPCNEDCLKDYDAAALKCGQIENEAQRRACQDSAHAAYKSCRADCERNSNRTCHEKWEDCQNYGPWSCRRPNPGSESKCYQCRDQCNSGAPPSGACRKCLF
jgi:hypothetical protein